MPDGTSALQAAALEAMRNPRLYPHRPERVDVVETHISVVFLAGERVYKVKKELALPFLDYSTIERRRHFCEEEIRLNSRLAPETYIGVRSLVRSNGSFCLGGPAEDTAVEYAVEMRRLPQDRSLEYLVLAGEATEAHIERVARRIAEFHGEAKPAPSRYGTPEDVKGRLDENFRTTLPYVGTAIDRSSYVAVERFSDAFVLRRRDLLAERAARGRVREGHGDLRAEHVVLESERISVYDCVEFDERLRFIDVASDLAFLCMDLERLGAPALAAALVRAYVERSEDQGVTQLLPFYASYRAWVRAKTACLRSSQLAKRDPTRNDLIAEAHSLSTLSRRFAWRAQLPLVLVFCGVAASGKSVLARELSHVSGYTRLNSDAIRKSLAGLALEERGGSEIYAEELTIRTYDEIARRAGELLDGGEGVLVDATFGRRLYRDRLRESLHPSGARVLFCECRAPAAVLEQRARRRDRAPEDGSDATWPIVQNQLRSFEGLDELPPSDHLIVRSDATLQEVLHDVEDFTNRP